jgi:hypothetical protein
LSRSRPSRNDDELAPRRALLRAPRRDGFVETEALDLDRDLAG